MGRLKVAVLIGGRSAEREVSLSTGRQVLASLDRERYQAFAVDTGATVGATAGLVPGEADVSSTPGWLFGDNLAGPPAGLSALLSGQLRPDVALICLHGRYGEDGTIQGLLELLDIPYTGSGVLSSALAMDKVMSKRVLRGAGIPTPADVVIHGLADAERYRGAMAAGQVSFPLPVVVKPNRQGSTIGITIAHTQDQLTDALRTALAYDQEVLVEQFMSGMEITAPVLGNDDAECLPLIEIVPSSGFYDYEAKYTPGATDEIVPARLDPVRTAEVKEIALKSHNALKCRGFSRTDMMVDGNSVWVLEVNTIPGMTPTSLLPCSAAAAGISFPHLLDRMIALALEDGSREPAIA